MLLMFGILYTIGFVIIYLYLTLDLWGFIGTTVTAIFSALMCMLFYFQSVSSLYTARVTQATIQILTQVSLPISEIKRHLKELIHLKKGIENIESEEEFIKYIKLMIRSTSSSSLENGPDPSSVLSKTCIKIITEVFDQEIKHQIKECW